jgi:hypothetical protein
MKKTPALAGHLRTVKNLTSVGRLDAARAQVSKINQALHGMQRAHKQSRLSDHY